MPGKSKSKKASVMRPELSPEIKFTPEMEAQLSAMRKRVENLLANMEGVKQAAVMYMMMAYGKNVNDRQMKRVTRRVSNPVLMGSIVTVERFDYNNNGFSQHLATFTTTTPAIKGADFTIEFKAGFPLTSKQEEDVAKIMAYKNPELND